MDTSQRLQIAYETAKTGDRSKARQIIMEVLKVEPNNDAAWYLYARIAETRQKSIYCLEKVLEINPSHKRASQDLERFKSKRTASPNRETEQYPPRKQGSARLPGWIWVIIVGFACMVAVSGLGFIVFNGAILVSPQSSVPATAQPPLVISTPTNDCTCTRTTDYLNKTFSRVDIISSQIMSIEIASEEGSFLQLNFAAFSSEAKTIYREQLEETPPTCLQAIQNKSISLLWNWQQTMEYAASGKYDAVDAFIQGFMDDFSALESEGERLLQEELNGCILDPNSGPTL